MIRPGRAVAALAGAAQLLSGFLAWTAGGVVGLDVSIPVAGTIAIGLVALAALPLVALLVGDLGWPRLLSGTLTALLVLAHLADTGDRRVSVGVVVAIGAAVLHWLAAALATGTSEAARSPARA